MSFHYKCTYTSTRAPGALVLGALGTSAPTVYSGPFDTYRCAFVGIWLRTFPYFIKIYLSNVSYPNKFYLATAVLIASVVI